MKSVGTVSDTSHTQSTHWLNPKLGVNKFISHYHYDFSFTLPSNRNRPTCLQHSLLPVRPGKGEHSFPRKAPLHQQRDSHRTWKVSLLKKQKCFNKMRKGSSSRAVKSMQCSTAIILSVPKSTCCCWGNAQIFWSNLSGQQFDNMYEKP